MKHYNLGTYKVRSRGESKFKTFIHKVWFWTKVAAFLALVTGVAFAVGAATFSTTKVEATTSTVEKQVVVPGPILDRIADCESGNGKPGTGAQLSKDGQTVIHMNSNGTYDIGKWQINSIHRGKATALGFDLFTEAGNKSFAEWMWNNMGTGDWDSSAKCWRQ